MKKVIKMITAMGLNVAKVTGSILVLVVTEVFASIVAVISALFQTIEAIGSVIGSVPGNVKNVKDDDESLLFKQWENNEYPDFME